MFDCLTHLSCPRVPSAQALLEGARDAGVTDIVEAGVAPDGPYTLPSVGVTVHEAYGLHPQAIDAFAVTAQLDALPDLLARPAVCAVGEIGLDRRQGMPPPGLQELVLETQLRLAGHLQLPVLLHQVDAIGALLLTLKRVGVPAAGGMLHGFGGPQDLVGPLRRMGLYFSFGALVLSAHAKRCREAAAKVPLDRLLVETDCPDHPPAGRQVSGPGDLPRIVGALAELRGVSFQIIADATAANARRLFGLPSPGSVPGPA